METSMYVLVIGLTLTLGSTAFMLLEFLWGAVLWYATLGDHTYKSKIVKFWTSGGVSNTADIFIYIILVGGLGSVFVLLLSVLIRDFPVSTIYSITAIVSLILLSKLSRWVYNLNKRLNLHLSGTDSHSGRESEESKYKL